MKTKSVGISFLVVIIMVLFSSRFSEAESYIVSDEPSCKALGTSFNLPFIGWGTNNCKTNSFLTLNPGDELIIAPWVKFHANSGLDNEGTIKNLGRFFWTAGFNIGTTYNFPTGQIDFLGGGDGFEHSGQIYNHGTIENETRFYNAGDIFNYGTFVNTENNRVFDFGRFFPSNGHIINICGGLFINLGTVDGDQVSDSCDFDADGVEDFEDNCLLLANPEQGDFDGDGEGDACDTEYGPLEPPPPMMCDIDGDDIIDHSDIHSISMMRGTTVPPGSPIADPDEDGIITVLDARSCVLLCTFPRCGAP